MTQKTNLNGHHRQRQHAPADDPDAPLQDKPRRKRRHHNYIEEEDPPTRPAPDYDPAAAISKRERLVVPQKRFFKLAPHQRLLEASPWGRFGVHYESEYGFKVLRDPRTGRPVVREHGDLRPGEISLVLE